MSLPCPDWEQRVWTRQGLEVWLCACQASCLQDGNDKNVHPRGLNKTVSCLRNSYYVCGIQQSAHTSGRILSGVGLSFWSFQIRADCFSSTGKIMPSSFHDTLIPSKPIGLGLWSFIIFISASSCAYSLPAHAPDVVMLSRPQFPNLVFLWVLLLESLLFLPSLTSIFPLEVLSRSSAALLSSQGSDHPHQVFAESMNQKGCLVESPSKYLASG